MKCAIVHCQEQATIGGYCVDHDDWVRKELADDKYRVEEPPSSIGWKAPYRGPEQPSLGLAL